jgi:hypothetical protein
MSSEKSLEIIEKFKKSWLEEISKIENREIDSEGIHNIYAEFQHDLFLIDMKKIVESGDYPDFLTDFSIIQSKLIIALETACSRYRLKNRGLWARIAEGIGVV